MLVPELGELLAAKIVDARASSCPGPLLEAKKGITTVKIGEVLEVWSGDTQTRIDLPHWCEKSGHEFLGVISETGYDRLFIRRLQ